MSCSSGVRQRTLAKAAIDSMSLWDAPRLGHGPVPKAGISFTGLAWSAVNGAIRLAKRPFAEPQPEHQIVPGFGPAPAA